MFNIRNFEDARGVLRKTQVTAIIFCIASLFMPESMDTVRLALIFIAIIFFSLTMFILFKYCKCPKCGKQLTFGVLAVNSCPKCHRNLISGKKEKKRR